ncbi:Hypothetical predicted protein [Podarcis lilfordi]|uniref:Uncharacterized protein n=1 Tax=Podarcis lilfordi TaxID=74358 RepID=A0AA35P573_9SAUR|nr:Hypothetical predicted protein [Podarcis lilfordi]
MTQDAAANAAVAPPSDPAKPPPEVNIKTGRPRAGRLTAHAPQGRRAWLVLLLGAFSVCGRNPRPVEEEETAVADRNFRPRVISPPSFGAGPARLSRLAPWFFPTLLFRELPFSHPPPVYRGREAAGGDFQIRLGGPGECTCI